MSEKHPPSFTAAKLYERTSAKGNQYFSGRLGGIRLAIVKTTETDDKGNPVWLLRMSEAPAYTPQQGDETASASNPRKPPDFAR